MNNLLHKFNSSYFFGIPAQSKVIYLLITFYLFVILESAILPKIIFGDKGKPYQKFYKLIFRSNLGLGVIGLFLTFARFEFLPIFSWRFWQILTLLSIIGLNLYFYIYYEKKVREQAAKETEKQRKEKWLPKGKKKKR